MSTTIEEDKQMRLHSSLDSSSNHELSGQSRIAMQFRLADKKLLSDIIHDNNNDSISSCNVEEEVTTIATTIDTITYDNLVTLFVINIMFTVTSSCVTFTSLPRPPRFRINRACPDSCFPDLPFTKLCS